MAHHLASAVVDVIGEASSVALAPVPSTRRSRRERGRALVTDLARDAAALLVDVGVEASVHRGLRLVRQTSDQHALGREERARNVAHSMRAEGFPPAPVVVVDDVLTTGATLVEAVRALRARGPVEILGGATVVAAVPGSPPVAGHPSDGLRSR